MDSCRLRRITEERRRSMGAVLNTVYNNYLTTYTPKALTRYDTHKKSELRSVYNSIVKLNKDASLCLPTGKDAQNYAVDLKENARALHNTIADLGGLDEDGLLNQKSAFSTDEDVATASYIGGDDFAGAAEDFGIEVQSLASPQENMGYFLENEPIGLAAGTYSFDVAVNDMNYEFQFSIGEDETNRDVQSRLARLINNSSIGIRASLLEEDGASSLRLTSDNTGSGDNGLIFNVSDDRTSKTSGTVAYFGLDYVSREPSNARFLLNGEERTASSNRFTVGKMFEVELKGISEEGKETQIGLKTDVDSLTDNVLKLVNGYNDFIRAASSYLETQADSKRLVNEMAGVASAYRNSMESMGLTFNEDGTIQADSRALRQTAFEAENPSEEFSYLKDFGSSLLRKTDQVSLDPMNYVRKTVVAYKNPGHTFVSPYTTSAYSGMMFNSYC